MLPFTFKMDVIITKHKHTERVQLDIRLFICLFMHPSACLFVCMLLFVQLHEEAWYRFVILSLVSVGIYAFYGQYNATRAITDHYHPISTDSA